MGHIFISYSHKDTKYAHALADHLKSRGFNFWIDERLDYGSQWPHEIQKQLDSCDAFLVIMTPRSFASEWVQSELQRAKRKLKPIFPLLLEGDEPWLSMESTQYFDVRGEMFPDAKFYSALQRVVTVDPRTATLNRLPKAATKTAPPRSNKRTGMIAALIGGIAIAMCACAAMIGPVINWMNRQAAPTDTPKGTTLSQITPSQSISEIVVLTPTFTVTLPPTLTFAPPTASMLPTLTATIVPTTQAPPTVPPPTLEPAVGSEEWRQQLLPLSDGTISNVLIVGRFRRESDLVGISLDDQRNILITELGGRTNQSGGYYQSLDNDTLAGVGAMLVFVRAAKIRTDETLKTLTDDDIRNIFIVEIWGRTSRTDLQGLSNIQLVHVALSIRW
jgi:hypothetical protein